MRTVRIPLRVVVALVVSLALSAMAPIGAADATTCTWVTYNGQPYCASSISAVKATRDGVGARVVLQGVSVTARTTSTVTVAALESAPCPAGQYCGALLSQQSLTVSWRGRTRPAVRTVVNLFGTTTQGSLAPVGYTPSAACYIDYC